MKVKLLFLSLIFIIVSLFFKDTIIRGNLPIPSDTIVGLYHPYKDYYAKNYPRGIPFKNFLITDPIRQQIPWKSLTIDLEKKLQLPLWNPYNFSGTPHLANFQSGVFYPFNLLFFVLPFHLSWTFFIFIQPLLAAIFIFIYLNNLKLTKASSLFGAIIFAFCGFSIAWMYWGNIINTALWLPFILYLIDKIFIEKTIKLKWFIFLTLALTFSFFAGHLQIFFYVWIVSTLYFIYRWFEKDRRIKTLLSFGVWIILFLLITSLQWVSTLQFIRLSARNADLAQWSDPGWFIPIQNVIQFLFPDFFGNPATLNYFGIFNYGEFIGYVGIIGLILAIFAIFFRREKNTYFFTFLLVVSLVFALPNFISTLPYKLSIPFLSTSQPTRLMFVIDFALSILAAFGLDLYFKQKNIKKILTVLILVLIAILSTWGFILGGAFNLISSQDLAVSKRNLIFPTVLFTISLVFLISFYLKDKIKLSPKIVKVFPYLIIGLLIFDLFRFGWKFLPFTNAKYLYPKTKTISFLTKNLGNNRLMETDSRIFPPNFSIMYKLQSIDGYDPLYLQRYGELMAAIGRNKPDINPPFGFNRIITPQGYLSPIFSLMGVKYIVSFEELNIPGFDKVFEEKATKVYKNPTFFERVFFVEKTITANNKKEAINLMFDGKFSFKLTAVVEGEDSRLVSKNWKVGKAMITKYEERRVEISTQNDEDGFLILSDSFYPTWKATIDGKLTKIYLTDYNFRGIVVPGGEHKIIFYDNLF